MKPEFESYLRDIGVSDVLYSRVEQLLSEFRPFIPDEPQSLFLTDHIDKEGKRHYGNLWIISTNFVMECKNIGTEESIDLVKYHEGVQYLEIKKENYDVKLANDDSRLFVKVQFQEDLSGELRAARNNCDYLRDILTTHFMRFK